MKLNRRQLRTILLSEIKVLNEQEDKAEYNEVAGINEDIIQHLAAAIEDSKSTSRAKDGKDPLLVAFNRFYSFGETNAYELLKREIDAHYKEYKDSYT